jgi:FAD/FMN-containing dehydrogenase
MSPTDLDELAAAIEGAVISPGGPGYEQARLVWNCRFDDARPTAVVRPATAGDVRATVQFARDHGLPLVARSGGHSFAGYSTGDCLVVDLGEMTEVTVDASGERATLGAGSTMLPTYRALWPHRMAVCGGICPTVGIAGLTTGGGLGVLSRRHGLTCDNLVEVEIVTSAGRIERANEGKNADLLWATRGGGGGSFGIITALTFELAPVDVEFTALTYVLPWSGAESVLTAWQEWLPGSPRGMWAAVELETQDPAADDLPTVVLEVIHAGSREEAEAAIAELLGAAGVAPISLAAHSGPFVDIEHDFFCKGLRGRECTMADKSASGRFPREAFYARSDVASGPWPSEGLRTWVEWMERRQRDRMLTPSDFSPMQTIGKLLIEPADGAVSSVPADATAFVHRDNLFVTQYQSRWWADSSRAVADANIAWTDGLYAAVSEYRSGFAYQNYIDPHLDDWQRAYYGTNLPRLREVKSKYDPDDLFHFAQSVPPADPDSAPAL